MLTATSTLDMISDPPLRKDITTTRKERTMNNQNTLVPELFNNATQEMMKKVLNVIGICFNSERSVSPRENVKKHLVRRNDKVSSLLLPNLVIFPTIGVFLSVWHV